MFTSYSVAIRTLGTAGEKYHKTLLSISQQSIQPTNIYVYIPYGYDLPEYTIGREIYVRCQKGMIAQRALDFDEIKDEWILFLDDDIYLPEDYMQRAISIVNNTNADMLTANFYQEEKAKIAKKITMFFHSVLPMCSTKWAYRVSRSGRFKYNIKPQSDVLLTQTGPGACMLCRKSSYLASKFYEEKWMDDFGYALGDDQLFHYKMYLLGTKEYIWNNSGAIHLDAGKANRKFDTNSMRKASAVLCLVWLRSIYQAHVGQYLNKCLDIISFAFSVVLRLIYSITFMFRGYYDAPLAIIKGINDGVRYSKKSSFSSLPNFRKTH